MDEYAAFVHAKRGLLDTLRSGWAAGTIATPDTRTRVLRVITQILAAGASQGVLRADDVTAALAGVLLSNAVNEAPDGQTERILDLLLEGMRLH
jgi:hypothetical protein